MSYNDWGCKIDVGNYEIDPNIVIIIIIIVTIVVIIIIIIINFPILIYFQLRLLVWTVFQW